MPRVGEDAVRGANLDQGTLVEVGRAPGDAGRLLHVVGDDDNGVLFLEPGDEILHRGRGNGIQGRTGFVHQDHLGLEGDGPGDAEPLLLAAGEPGAGLIQPVADLLPETGLFQRILDNPVQFAPAPGQAMDPGAIGNIVIDGLGKRVGFLKDHAHPGPQGHHVDRTVIDVQAVKQDLPAHATGIHGIVHPVQAAQEGGLAAPRRPDHGQDLVAGDIDGDVADDMLLAVIDIDIPAAHAGTFHEGLSHGAGIAGPGHQVSACHC